METSGQQWQEAEITAIRERAELNTKDQAKLPTIPDRTPAGRWRVHFLSVSNTGTTVRYRHGRGQCGCRLDHNAFRKHGYCSSDQTPSSIRGVTSMRQRRPMPPRFFKTFYIGPLRGNARPNARYRSVLIGIIHSMQ